MPVGLLGIAAYRREARTCMFSVLTLLSEASRVIEIRLRMFAEGKASSEEVLLMMTEKIEAMQDAGRIIGRGGDPALVIDSYRRIVTANIERLSAKG